MIDLKTYAKFKVIVNLFSYEKSDIFLPENTHHTFPGKKSYFFLSIPFSFSRSASVFCFTLVVEVVLFFLMESCLLKKFQTK